MTKWLYFKTQVRHGQMIPPLYNIWYKRLWRMIRTISRSED